MSDPAGGIDPGAPRRRDPARWWYLAAAAAVGLVLALELSGVLDVLGP